VTTRKQPVRKRSAVAVDSAAPSEGEARGRRPEEGAFPIVGVGASAGGLEAFTNLLQALDGPSGLALVLIQHLDPTHTSFLREALVKTTTMRVAHAEDGMRVEPNHVYVIPPNTCLGIHDGKLTLAPRPDDPKAQYLPVDFFFRALAAERGSRAIGVVLSGTASDGTEGLKAIKEASGITFAQEPRSAKFDEMPRTAIDAGVVDFNLPIPGIAQELLRLSHHPYVIAPESATLVHDDEARKNIFALVQHVTRVDFSEYKAPTFDRRLARRMALSRTETLPAYLALLAEKPDEVLALYEDCLIHVTSFFRDPEVFESLKTTVFPAVLKNKPEDAAIRMWVAGCSTGEEVYSLGIALLDFLGDSRRPIQLFGTDLSSRAIETARAGLYPDSGLREVSEEVRRKYFTKAERGYRINKSVRDLCVFVQHDLARDPPFSKLDLVSCRNVLIYFDQALQKRVVPTFHYALRQPGFLLLGRAENVAGFRQLFEPVDKTNKLFARTAVRSALRFARRSEVQGPDLSAKRGSERVALVPHHADLSRRLDRLLLDRYAPPGIVVNDRMEILQYRGQTGAYLEPAPGEPLNNAMQMARDGLPMTLRASVILARKKGTSVRAAGIEVVQEGVTRTCDVVVIPLVGAPEARDALYLILFEDVLPVEARKQKRGASPKPETVRDQRRIPKLEEALAATKEYLQTILTEHGRTNEDLGTANEELVSGNEELQSMNEELETAKEELQSINEELTTVNDELQARNQEVTQINSDLVNLLTTVDIPILILDNERKIRRFTPKARRILNVLQGDIGRPFEDIKPNIDVPDLDRQIAEVIESMEVKESEVQDRHGHWYRLQIRPYKTTENRIDGAIVSLFDIDALKHLVKEAQRSNAEAERANRTKDEFLATLSHELRTPLSSMLMRAQLLRHGTMDAAKVLKTGAAIEAGIRTQVQLIEDLLDVSRIVTGTVSLDLQPVDLAHVVRAAVEGLTHGIERKSLSLEVELALDGATALVYGDQARLEQVVTNLVANAIKFTPTHGTIRVSLALTESSAVIAVKDSGMGIAANFLPHVFNRFTQEDSTSTRTHGGLGLGLAIVRHLVDMHRGTVEADSPGTGLGATFSLTLPLLRSSRIPASPESKAALEHAVVDSSVLVGLRILVVDDDRPTREAITDMLTHTGADVRMAESAAEALAAVEEFRPELLLCDIEMPGEDGYALIRKVRSRGAARSGDIPALALTALARDDDRDRALSAGYQIHLAKPVGINQLTEAVLELAAKRGGERLSALP
jgi:two-component system CheB/CheR fusion protein